MIIIILIFYCHLVMWKLGKWFGLHGHQTSTNQRVFTETCFSPQLTPLLGLMVICGIRVESESLTVYQ